VPSEIVESHTETRWERIRSRWNDLRPSVRWIIGAAIIGYLPQLVVELPLPVNGDELAGFALGWAFWVTIPCTLVAGVLIIYELVRFVLVTIRGD